MIDSFAAATRLERTGDGAFEARIEESWFQGRGAFGGLVAAIFVRAIDATAGADGRPLRTLTCHFCAPAQAGAARVEIAVARSSNAVTHFTARMVQDDGVVAIATAARARGRDVDIAYNDRRIPDAAPPEAAILLDLQGIGPTFARHFEYRFAFGTTPFSSASSSHFGGWVRHRHPGPLDAALTAAYADAWPPAFFTRIREPRPAATVALTYQYFTDFGAGIEAREGDPLLVTARSDVLAGGYAGQENEIWTPGGTLVAVATQLVAVIR